MDGPTGTSASSSAAASQRIQANPLNVGREGAASEGTGMDVVLHHLMIMQVANIKSIT